MKISYFLTALCAAFVFNVAVSQSAFADQNNNTLPTEKSLKADLAAANKMANSDEKKALIDSLQTSLDLLQQIQAQQKNNDALQNTINGADAEIQKNNSELQNLKKQLNTAKAEDYQSRTLADLQAQLEKLTNQQQETQAALSVTNGQLAGQSSVSERAQTTLTANLKRTQELNQKLSNSGIS